MIADQLLRKIGKSHLTVGDIKNLCKDYGYDVVEYGSPSSMHLMDELGIRPAQALTYCQGSIHLVFVDRSLDDNEKRLVLAHELGHIVSGHLFNPGEKDYNIQQEYEANEFAHYLMNPGKITQLSVWLLRRWKIIAAVAAAVLIGVFVWENIDVGYYVTKTGTKYHRRNCEYVKGKWDVKRIFNVDGYEPCSVCID